MESLKILINSCQVLQTCKQHSALEDHTGEFLKNHEILIRLCCKVVQLCRHQQYRHTSNCSVVQRYVSKLWVKAGLNHHWQSSCRIKDFVQAVYLASQTVHNYVRNINAVTALSGSTWLNIGLHPRNTNLNLKTEYSRSLALERLTQANVLWKYLFYNLWPGLMIHCRHLTSSPGGQSASGLFIHPSDSCKS